MILIWCLAYAIMRSLQDTVVNTTSLLKGRPVTPRGRRAATENPDAATRPSYTGRTAGAVGGLIRESFLDGWRFGWRWGRQSYRRRAGRWQSWRPWQEPPPAPSAGPTADGRGQDPPSPGPGPGPGDPGQQAPTVDPVDPAEPVDPEVVTDPPDHVAYDDDMIEGTPLCWSDLEPDEQVAVVAAARDQWGQRWTALTVDQRAATVRDWINQVYGARLTSTDVFTAQARRDDPTWLSGPLDPGPARADPVYDPATAGTDPTTFEGDLMAITSGETTNIANARAYYQSLEGHAITDIASQIELSRSYLTAAEMSDQAVLGAITAADEVARTLATAAAAVLTALEAHRLMEEAVASTPGAANTTFYRQS